MMPMLRHAALAAVLSLAGSACGAGEKGTHLGFNADAEATAADAGLPEYPGAKPYKESEQSGSAANVSMSTPLFGLKVVAMNLQVGDPPQRVAVFYRRALARYGKVLDCSDAAANSASVRNEDAEELVCDRTDPGSNTIVYKVGTEANQRIVAIKPHGRGTRFSLVRVDTRA